MGWPRLAEENLVERIGFDLSFRGKYEFGLIEKHDGDSGI